MLTQQNHSGIVPAILNQIYKSVESTEKRGGGNSLTVGLSAWSLCGQTIVDLLSSEVPKTRGALEFASVECPSYQSALQVCMRVCCQ
jgi:hypothetical protein